MKLRILSDIHLEFGSFKPKQGDEDVVVLAGDIGVGCMAFPWARKTFPDKIIVYVAGNHEFYGREFPAHYDDMRESAVKHGVYFLQDQATGIHGVKFVGATLWTDFNLFGRYPQDALVALRGMTDFRTIEKMDTLLWLEAHRFSRANLDCELKYQDRATVVITHHAPSSLSVPKRFEHDALSAAYASRLEDMILAYEPALWIHGHTHDSLDYRLGKTRIVCNPRGYVGHELNKSFNPDLIVEINDES